jgi:hypothetical protein
VVGNGGLRHIQQFGQLGDVAWAFSDEVEQSQSLGIAYALADVAMHQGDFVFGDSLCKRHFVYISKHIYIERDQYSIVQGNVKGVDILRVYEKVVFIEELRRLTEHVYLGRYELRTVGAEWCVFGSF